MIPGTLFGNKILFFLLLGLLPLACGDAHAAWQASLSEKEIHGLNVAAADHYYNQQFNTQGLNPSLQTNKVKASTSALGLEVLLIELQEVKNRSADDPRLAEVFVFDYATNSASVLLVDVQNQKVINSSSIDNIHLPLNDREVAVATQILLSNTALMAKLTLEYEKQIGKPLESLQQLDMKVSIWNPGMNAQYSQQCKLTRCALVSLFTKSAYNFSVEPVINLSTANVNLDWVQ